MLCNYLASQTQNKKVCDLSQPGVYDGRGLPIIGLVRQSDLYEVRVLLQLLFAVQGIGSNFPLSVAFTSD